MILIFSIAMGADYSFYVKFIATRAPPFFGYIISVLASVQGDRLFAYSSLPHPREYLGTKINILGALLELPAKQHCRFGQFGRILR